MSRPTRGSSTAHGVTPASATSVHPIDPIDPIDPIEWYVSLVVVLALAAVVVGLRDPRLIAGLTLLLATLGLLRLRRAMHSTETASEFPDGVRSGR
jgi:hypothetical protein